LEAIAHLRSTTVCRLIKLPEHINTKRRITY